MAAVYSGDPFLKEVFGEGAKYLRAQYPKDMVLLKHIKKETSPITGGGTTFNFATRQNRNYATGAIAIDGCSFTAGSQGGARASESYKSLIANVELSRTLLNSSKTDKQSFRKAYADEIDNAVLDFKADVNRQLYGDMTGTIGVAGSVAGSVITLDATASPRYTPLTRFFQVGQTITIYVGNSDTVRQTTTVTAINTTTGEVTVTTIGATAAGDYISKNLARQLECNGLTNIISTTTTLHGLAPASYPLWVGNVRTTNEDPSETNMERLRVLGAQQDANYKFAITSWGVQSKYGSLLTSSKRYVNTVNLTGGYEGQSNTEQMFKGPEYNGVGPLIADNYVPAGTAASTGQLYLINCDDLTIMQNSEPGWIDEDGSVLSRKSATQQNQFVAQFCWDMNLVALRRNTMVRHNNLNVL